MGPKRRSQSNVDPSRSPRAGRARRNMQGCATCRIRKKLCSGPSDNGDCKSCLTMRVECLRCYGEPVPVEYRAPEVTSRLGGWHREKGTRRGDKLSLTDIVRKCSPSDHADGSDHPVPPTLSAPSPRPSTHWPFRPNPHSFDRHTGSPPSNSDCSTPSGPRRFKGNPLPSRVPEFNEDRSAARGIGSPGAANAMYLPPAPIKTSDLHCEMNNLPCARWTTIATTPYGVPWHGNSTLTGCGALGCEARDCAQSELGIVHLSTHALDCSMTTTWEAVPRPTPLYHNPGAMRGANAAWVDSSTIPMRNRQSGTEYASNAIHGQESQDSRAAHGEAALSGINPFLCTISYSSTPNQLSRCWPPTFSEYTSYP